MPSGPRNPGENSPGLTPYLAAPPGPGFGSYFDSANSTPNANIPQANSYEQGQFSPAQEHAIMSVNHGVDEFGVGSSSMAPLSPRLGISTGAGGGKFATFPIKPSNRTGIQLRDEAPPSLGHTTRNPSLSFSSQIAEALNVPGKPSYGNMDAVNQNNARVFEDFSNSTEPPGFDDPVPIYQATTPSIYGTPPAGPPNPAPTLMNPWNDDGSEVHNGETPPRTSVDESGDTQLAYMSSTSDLSHRAQDRHGRFSAMNDVEQVKYRSSEDGSGRKHEVPTGNAPEVDEGMIDLPNMRDPILTMLII